MNYDVFISSKSEDYIHARQIYDYLVECGYCVFLADAELRKKGVAEYGEVIDDALDSSEHMILFSSQADFVRSSYVKNEWRTFLEEKRSGRKAGNIVTVLKDIKVESLPISLRHFQSFRLENFEHVVDFLPKSSGEVPPVKPEKRELPIEPAKPISPVKPLTADEEKKRWQREWDNWNKERKATPQKRTKVQKGKYAVGDLYDDGERRGVVFEVSQDGEHGKIVSLAEDRKAWASGTLVGYWLGAVSACMLKTSARNFFDGEQNHLRTALFSNRQEKFPAFAWCASLGQGWYLPAIDELKSVMEHSAALNTTLKENEAKELNFDDCYWSSTEFDDDKTYAYICDKKDKGAVGNFKGFKYSVRAVAKF